MPDVIALARSMLETSVERWAALARIDAELLARQPEPGEWSAIQALQHAVDTEAAVFEARMRAIRDGRPLVGFDPDVQGNVDRIGLTASELVAVLVPLRAESLATLATIAPDDLAKTVVHPDLGVVSMAELLNEWAAHDTMHIVQAERALMQPFIPASGPWRIYFKDHDVALRAADGG